MQYLLANQKNTKIEYRYTNGILSSVLITVSKLLLESTFQKYVPQPLW